MIFQPRRGDRSDRCAAKHHVTKLFCRPCGPSGAVVHHLPTVHTTYVVGYGLPPLRGWKKLSYLHDWRTGGLRQVPLDVSRPLQRMTVQKGSEKFCDRAIFMQQSTKRNPCPTT